MGNITKNVRKVSMSLIIQKTRWIFARFEIPKSFEQEPAHLNNVGVAYADVFFSSVDDRPHTLRDAGVLIEKLLYAAEVYGPLSFSILEIVVAEVANLFVIGTDEISFR